MQRRAVSSNEKALRTAPVAGTGEDVVRMDMRIFCSTLSIELASWREKMYGIISHVETLPPLDRQHVAPDINTLHALISEIDDSLKAIKTSCPLDFNAREGSV